MSIWTTIRDRIDGFAALTLATAMLFVGLHLTLAATGMHDWAISTQMAALIFGLLATWRMHSRWRAALRKSEELEVRLEDLSVQLARDPLTGHLNRLAFTRRLAELAKSSTTSSMIMVVFFDLNRFKEVNDTLGHDVGDALLKEVGSRAAKQLDGCVALARLGGDEFAAILYYEGEEHARRISAALVDAIGRPFKLGDRHVEVSASVGVAIGDPGVHGGEELLRRADVAMYEVKGTSGGAFHIFDDLLSNRQMRESLIRTELAKTRFNDRLKLHYQPIINARTGRIQKAEALLRSNTDSLIGISPAQVVSVAEDSGQIVALTDWTIDTALEAAKSLGIPIAVNLSPVYFRHNDFADRVIERLIATESHPSSLIIEVTEGVLISDISSARESIDHLRAIGLKVYLDDFGTGYSSLSYLQNFELDGIKLDRSFIQDLGKTDKAVKIIRSMIDFSHSLNMKTVVEGIESEWQARILQLQGCDFLQGYDLGLPMGLTELRAQLDAYAEEEGGSSHSKMAG